MNKISKSIRGWDPLSLECRKPGSITKIDENARKTDTMRNVMIVTDGTTSEKMVNGTARRGSVRNSTAVLWLLQTL